MHIKIVTLDVNFCLFSVSALNRNGFENHYPTYSISKWHTLVLVNIYACISFFSWRIYACFLFIYWWGIYACYSKIGSSPCTRTSELSWSPLK